MSASKINLKLVTVLFFVAGHLSVFVPPRIVGYAVMGQPNILYLAGACFAGLAWGFPGILWTLLLGAVPWLVVFAFVGGWSLGLLFLIMAEMPGFLLASLLGAAVRRRCQMSVGNLVIILCFVASNLLTDLTILFADFPFPRELLFALGVLVPAALFLIGSFLAGSDWGFRAIFWTLLMSLAPQIWLLSAQLNYKSVKGYQDETDMIYLSELAASTLGVVIATLVGAAIRLTQKRRSAILPANVTTPTA